MSNINLEEKRISGEYIFNGKIVTLKVDTVELPNGKTATREVMEHPGAVAVAALNENNELYFVRQFRYPFGDVILELPAGKLEIGEDPLESAKRELKEEVGVEAENFQDMGLFYPAAAYCNEVIHMYFATGLTLGECNPDEDEFLEPEKINIDEAVNMVLSGEIKDSKTQTLVLKTSMMLKNKMIQG